MENHLFVGQTAIIRIVPNGFFYITQGDKVVEFVRNKHIACFDNHTSFLKYSLAVKNEGGDYLVTIDKTGFDNFDEVVYKALVKNWEKFWS
jgi:hypothetical protein